MNPFEDENNARINAAAKAARDARIGAAAENGDTAELRERIFQFEAEIQRIAHHVGAVCGGVDTGHTAEEIIRCIGELKRKLDPDWHDSMAAEAEAQDYIEASRAHGRMASALRLFTGHKA